MKIIEDTVTKIEQLKQLTIKIEACRKEVRKLPELELEYKIIHEALTKALDSMDVTTRGNFGWERRIVPFLLEFSNCVKRLESTTPSESKEGD